MGTSEGWPDLMIVDRGPRSAATEKRRLLDLCLSVWEAAEIAGRGGQTKEGGKKKRKVLWLRIAVVSEGMWERTWESNSRNPALVEVLGFENLRDLKDTK